MSPAKKPETPEEGRVCRVDGGREGERDTTLNVYQRLNLAKRLAAEQQLTKVKGEGLKFAYLPIDQMKPIVEEAMNAAGLVLMRSPIEYEDAREPWEVRNDYGATTKWFHIRGRRSYWWVNVDNPEDRTEPQEYDGEAKDNSDKTLNKLSTAILKAFYKEEFNFSESPKDDTDNTEDEVKAERSQARRPQAAARPDPFFNKAAAKPAPAKQAEVSEIALDRPPELKREQIVKWSKDPTARLRMLAAAKAEGHDAGIFSEEALKDFPDMIDPLYIAGLRALKGKEASE